MFQNYFNLIPSRLGFITLVFVIFFLQFMKIQVKIYRMRSAKKYNHTLFSSVKCINHSKIICVNVSRGVGGANYLATLNSPIIIIIILFECGCHLIGIKLKSPIEWIRSNVYVHACVKLLIFFLLCSSRMVTNALRHSWHRSFIVMVSIVNIVDLLYFAYELSFACKSMNTFFILDLRDLWIYIRRWNHWNACHLKTNRRFFVLKN